MSKKLDMNEMNDVIYALLPRSPAIQLFRNGLHRSRRRGREDLRKDIGSCGWSETWSLQVWAPQWPTRELADKRSAQPVIARGMG